jgi:hypothetical protein
VPRYVLRYDLDDERSLAVLIGGLATYGTAKWQRRERDGFVELYSNDVTLMRQIWRRTRRHVRGSAIEPDATAE